MQLKMRQFLIESVGTLLVATGIAVFISIEDSIGFLPPHDPLLGISMPMMYCIVGAAELGVGVVCLFSKQTWLKLSLIFILAHLFLAYQFTLFWSVGPKSFIGYWGGLAEAFGIQPAAMERILQISLAYLVLAGWACLALTWLNRPKTVRANPSRALPMTLKFSCINPACRQHIMVDLSWCGRQTQCPACGTSLSVPTFSFQNPNLPTK